MTDSSNDLLLRWKLYADFYHLKIFFNEKGINCQ